MLDSNMELPENIWAKLNFAWGMFFAIVGGINIYVFYNFDTDTWMSFKMFGVIGLTLAFAFVSILAISKYIPEEEKSESPEKWVTTRYNKEISMLYAIISEDIKNSLPLRKQARPKHLERLNALKEQGRLILAGPHPAIDSTDPGSNGLQVA